MHLTTKRIMLVGMCIYNDLIKYEVIMIEMRFEIHLLFIMDLIESDDITLE